MMRLAPESAQLATLVGLLHDNGPRCAGPSTVRTGTQRSWGASKAHQKCARKSVDVQESLVRLTSRRSVFTGEGTQANQLGRCGGGADEVPTRTAADPFGN